jgi:hypothetical protein
MIGSALIQVIKVNDPRSGVKEGRPWAMQDAECLLLDENGQPSMVGVLSLPKDLMSEAQGKDQFKHKVQPGVYTGSFALRSGLRDRRIEAVLTSLVPAADRIRTQPAGPAKQG